MVTSVDSAEVGKPVWTGSLPKGWSTKKVKHVAMFTTGWTPPTGNAASYVGDNPWATIGDLGPAVLHETSNCISDEAAKVSGIPLSPAGSLLFSFKLSVGQVSIAGRPMFTNEAIATFAPQDGYSTRWAFYAFPVFIPENSAINIYGARLLNQQRINDAFIPLPPLEEQEAIASYLDAETARIDGLIQEKQRLSNVLGELRASVIGEAIQLGLRPDAKVVTTGVPWIGRVPSHWRVLRLKHLLDGIEQGWSPQCDSRQAEDHEWGVLKAGACNGGVFHPEEQKALQAGMVADPSIEVKPGDVLMSRASGSLDLVGSVAHVDDVRSGLMLSDKIFRLKIDESQGTSSKWLAMTFNTPAQRRQIASHVGGAEGLARNITSSAIKELWLAVPPPEEQMAIVEHVTGRVAHIDELTKAVGAEIALLQELRSATITDAVLGRIDVREHMKH